MNTQATTETKPAARIRIVRLIAATLIAAGLPAARANDDCADAEVIAGLGQFSFDLTGATAEAGTGVDSCWPTEQDVWFRWTAPSGGGVLVGTCGLTGVDTTVSVYRVAPGDPCPATGGAQVACSDNACWLQSQALFNAMAGEEYLIRVGAAEFTPGDAGEFNIRYEGPSPTIALPCNAPVEVNQGDTFRVNAQGGVFTDPRNFTYVGNGVNPANVFIYGLADPTVAINPSGTVNVTEGAGAVKRYRGTSGSGSFSTSASIEIASVYTVYVDCTGQALPASPCGAGCTQGAPLVGLASDAAAFTTADDFVPTDAGDITSLCFYGGYGDGDQACFDAAPTDSFRVRYFDDAGGRPGNVLAEYTQAGASLTLAGRAPTGRFVAERVEEYAFSVTHAALPVAAGACYWLEITNETTGSGWYWSGGGLNLDNPSLQITPEGDYAGATKYDHSLYFCPNIARDNNIDCTPPDDTPGEVCGASGLCQLPSLTAPGQRSGTGGRAADDFVPDQDGSIDGLCFWGSQDDPFASAEADLEVRYFADDGGRPGALAAGPFRAADGSLTVAAAWTGDLSAGGLKQYEYSAHHAPAALLGGQRYWVEISAAGDATWRWAFAEPAAGNNTAFDSGGDVRYLGRMAVDLAFCLNLAATAPAEPPVAGPPNQTCETVIEIASNGLYTIDNRGSEGSATAPADILALQGLVWYSFVATHTSMRLTLNGSEGAPGFLLIEKGVNADCLIAGTVRTKSFDDAYDPSVSTLVVGRRYFIAIGSISDLGRGKYRLRLNSPSIGLAVNGECPDAIAVGIPSQTSGHNLRGMSGGDYAPVDGVHYSGPGVWYKFTGTGEEIAVSLDNGALDFPARITVFTGGCNSNVAGHMPLAAVDGRLQVPGVSVATQAGVEYLVLVHGVRGAEGQFRLDLCTAGSGVDLDDLLLVLGNFGCNFGCQGDADGDGDTDLDDLLTVLSYFGRACGPLQASPLAPPASEQNELGG